MKRMLGRPVADSATASPSRDVSDDEQPARRRRKIDRLARNPKGVLLLALKGLSTLLIVTKRQFCCRSALCRVKHANPRTLEEPNGHRITTLSSWKASRILEGCSGRSCLPSTTHPHVERMFSS